MRGVQAFVLAGVVVLLAGCGDDDDRSGTAQQETVARTSAARPAPAKFGVLERPRGPQDELPRYAEMSFGDGGMSGYEVDTDESRFAGRRAGARYWVIPGDDDLCVSTVNGAGGCGSRKQAGAGFLFGQQIGKPLLAEDEARSYGVLPDGPDQATVTFDDGTTRTVAVKNNLWVLRSRKGLDSVEWKSSTASGRVRIPG